jgi:hypothetical protein
MADDYVGLNIGGGTPPEQPQTGEPGEAPDCPGCGGPMSHAEFEVNAPNPEMAERIFLAYYATEGIPTERLRAVAQGEAHFHTVSGNEPCPPESL